MIRFVLLVSSVCLVGADISHLFKTFAGYEGNHLGYNYDPPSVPASILFPQTTQSPFQLPEIIVNRNIQQPAAPSAAYLLPAPPPPSDHFPVHPPLADEPTDSYLPPLEDDEPHRPSVTYLPPPATESDVYLPPPSTETTVLHDDGYHYDRPAKWSEARSAPIRIEMNDLRCLLNRNGGYFKASLNLTNLANASPVIDIDLIDKRCRFRRTKTKFALDIQASDFRRCGVYVCSDKELCIRLRFATIAGMKSASDALLTLQCKLQEKIAVKTHAIRFGVADTGAQERSAGVVAQGGAQQPFRTHLELFRQSAGAKEEVRALEPGTLVPLGEELVLRVQVRSGDGWNQSRLADVSMQRVTPSGKVLNAANLVSADGCVNPSMASICPNPPVFEPPFGHRVAFRAVMFQGMRSGDEMVMSVRVVACIDPADCSERPTDCSGQNARTRIKRDLIGKISSADERIYNETLMEISKISFRVGMPNEQADAEISAKETHKLVAGIVLTATIMFICTLILIGVAVINRQVLPRRSLWAKN